MARPSKYNRARHNAICEALEMGASRTTAAGLVGIKRDTLEAWRAAHPKFDQDVILAIARAKRRASLTITQAIVNGDVTAAFRYLAYQEREEWSDAVIKHEHAGVIQHEHRHFDFSAFGDDEIASIAEIAERHRRDSLS